MEHIDKNFGKSYLCHACVFGHLYPEDVCFFLGIRRFPGIISQTSKSAGYYVHCSILGSYRYNYQLETYVLEHCKTKIQQLKFPAECV